MKIHFIIILYLSATNGKHVGSSKRDAFHAPHVTSDPANALTVDNHSTRTAENIPGFNQTEETVSTDQIVIRNSTTGFNRPIVSESTNSSPAWYTANKIHDSNSPTDGVTNLNTSPKIIQTQSSQNGEIQNNQSTLPGGNVSDNSQIVRNESSKSIFEGGPHKPRIIVTFLSTSKLENNHTEPVFVDPFQRILQIFLSTFIRDLTEPKFPFDRDERRVSPCGHRHGFLCPRCMTLKRETKNNTVLNLLPKGTALQPVAAKDLLKQEDLNNSMKVKRASEGLSPQEIHILQPARNDVNSTSADVKIANSNFTSPNAAGSLENLIIKDSNQETSNYLHPGRSNADTGLLELADSRKQQDANFTSSDHSRDINNTQKIVIWPSLDDQQFTHVSNINSNFSHEELQSNQIEVKPAVILRQDSRKPREDFTAADRNNTSNLGANYTKDQVSSDATNLHSVPLALQKQSNETKLIVSRGVNPEKPTGDTNVLIPRYINQQKLIEDAGNNITSTGDANTLAPKDVSLGKLIEVVNLHPAKDLNQQQLPEEAIVSREQRLERDASIVHMEDAAKNVKPESIVSRDAKIIIPRDNQRTPVEVAKFKDSEESTNLIPQKQTVFVRRNLDSPNLLNQQIIYADVKEGVIPVHNPNLRNRTSNLTRSKFSIASAKRATPLIEIVHLRTDETTTRIKRLEQELPKGGIEANVDQGVESEYLYSTSGDSVKRRSNVEVAVVQDQLNQTLSTASEKVATIKPPKHLNHYFLSISGDAEKSVAAANNSDSDEIVKMNQEKTTFDSNNADLHPPDTKNGFVYLQDTIETITSIFNDTDYDNTTDYENELPPPLEEEPEKPPTLYYSKNYYLFTVTVPVVAAVGLMIAGLCFCFRTSGFCCRLFLTDPTIEIKN